jgi:hypothetical protein
LAGFQIAALTAVNVSPDADTANWAEQWDNWLVESMRLAESMRPAEPEGIHMLVPSVYNECQSPIEWMWVYMYYWPEHTHLWNNEEWLVQVESMPDSECIPFL